jgi:hypothetical protein
MTPLDKEMDLEIAKLMVRLVVAFTVVVALGIWLTGCATPCWYKGKAISRTQAEDLKEMGMPVQCP